MTPALRSFPRLRIARRCAPPLVLILGIAVLAALLASGAGAQVLLGVAPFEIPTPDTPFVLSPFGAPAAAVRGDGTFTVVWAGTAIEGPPGARYSAVVERRIGVDGSSGEGRLLAEDISPDGGVEQPAVAPLDTIGTVASWVRVVQVGSFLERSPSTGFGPVMGPTFDSAAVSTPAIAAGVGRFVLAWDQQNFGFDSSPPPPFLETWFQVFDAAGQTVTPPISLGRWDQATPTFDLIQPAVAMEPGGSFVVAWTERGSGSVEPGLRGRLFDRDGLALTPPFVLQPSVRPLPAGEPTLVHLPARPGRPASYLLVVAGEVVRSDGLRPLLAHRFAPDGRPLGGYRILGTTTSGAPPRVAPDRFGNLTILVERFGVAELLLVNSDLVRQGFRLVVSDRSVPSFGPVGGLAISGDRLLVTVIRELEDDVSGTIFALQRDDDLCVVDAQRLLCDTAGDGGDFERVEPFGRRDETRLLGDVDGDGRDDQCLWRGGRFLCDTAHDGGTAELILRFGRADDTPLLGDLDGDGRDDPCLHRGNRFLCDTARDGGTAEVKIAFGSPGDTPFLADSDGDGIDEPCLLRQGPPEGRFLCDRARDGGLADRFYSLEAFLDELPTGVPVEPFMADLDGDGIDAPCVFAAGELLCGIFGSHGIPALTVVRRSVDGPADRPVLLGDLDGF